MRVRFAPSPTGFLHLGGLRTALFNYLLARKVNGTFILRIEDTDQSRTIPGAIDSLIDTLRWTGLRYDEGPGIRGKYGSYIQSERLSIYQKHAKILLDKGLAYKCYCPRDVPRDHDVGRCLREGSNYAIRLTHNNSFARYWTDGVYGHIPCPSPPHCSPVLIKSDGFPTYHFANVIDDHLMYVDTVLRGQEWLPSTPLHLSLYTAFEWMPPRYYHLPLLRNPDGSKLSKREDAARVEWYRETGFVPDALINFVAFLGWTPSVHYGSRETLTMDELVDVFDLQEINKADAVVDLRRLLWFNRQHLGQDVESIVGELKKLHPNYDTNYLSDVSSLFKGRVSTLKEIARMSSYFFEEPGRVDALDCSIIAQTYRQLTSLTIWSKEGLKQAFEVAKGQRSNDRQFSKEFMLTVRRAMTGTEIGPSLIDVCALLGRDRCLQRLSLYLEHSEFARLGP